MYVTLNNILKHPTFKDAKLLAGKDGTMKTVKRVSVFDCPVPDDILEANIIDQGDFFISVLQQFERMEDFFQFIQLLIKLDSSGLCVAANHVDHLVTEEIRSYCDAHRFPIIQVNEDIPYAYIMDTINRFISIDNLNAINELKLDKIMTARLADREKLQLLHSINGNIERFIQVICLMGEIRSEIGNNELIIEYLNRNQDIFVNSSRIKTLIISSSDQKKLKRHTTVVRQQMVEHYENLCLGISRIHECYNIDKALEEAKTTLDTAKTTGLTIGEYQPLSSTQLLISLKDSRELIEFYDAYVKKIEEHISGDNLDELLYTIETYVLHHGDYKQVSKIVNQHENTVRYRINKVRSFLGLEDDPIAFHETISLAVKSTLLLNERRQSTRED